VDDTKTKNFLFRYALRLGDDRLILGHRLSEWCGHAPILEEDIALANIALDLIGQAQNFLQLAGDFEGAGRDADKLAFHRDEREFTNLKLTEQPRGDFAFTIARQFLFQVLSTLQLEALQSSKQEQLAALAARALKESRYHLRHATQWMLRLGDGTAESNARAQEALDDLWSFTAEMFDKDEVESFLSAQKLVPDLATLKPKWEEFVLKTIQDAKLKLPTDTSKQTGSREGRHTEHLGHLLAEMQILPRSYPNATW